MATAVSNRKVRGWKQGSFDVPLGTDLSVGSPLAVASQCTHYGGDGGWARLRGDRLGQWETPWRWAGRKPSPASLQEFPHPLSKLPSTRI